MVWLLDDVYDVQHRAYMTRNIVALHAPRFVSTTHLLLITTYDGLLELLELRYARRHIMRIFLKNP